MEDKLRAAWDQIEATPALKHAARSAVTQRTVAPPRRRPMRLLAACCSIFILLLGGMGGYSAWAAPISYISLEGGPALELVLNRGDRVVSAIPYGEEGRVLLDAADPVGLTYTQALELLLAQGDFADALGEDTLSITVSSPKERELVIGIEGCMPATGADMRCHGLPEAAAQEARAQGMTLGQYRTYLALLEFEPSLTAEECKNVSTPQLQARLQTHTGHGADIPTDTPGAGNGMGSGNGNGGGTGMGNGNGNGGGNGHGHGRDHE